MKRCAILLVVLYGVGCTHHNTPQPKPREARRPVAVNTVSFNAKLYMISTIPTRVPDNHILKFRILDQTVGADYYHIGYPRFREKKPELEQLFSNKRVLGRQIVLTVDAIGVCPRTDSNFGGIPEFRHDDGTLLVGDPKKVTIVDWPNKAIDGD